MSRKADDAQAGPRQLVLDLPLTPGMGREDFFETLSNVAALQAISSWPGVDDGGAHALALVGPAGSGKTHLAEIWRAENDALRATVQDLRVEAVPQLLAAGALLLEDLPPAPSPAPPSSSEEEGEEWETALFHLLNLARQEGAHVLITSRSLPVCWPVRLPDLRSRLAAMPVTELLPPDDVLLRAVMIKLFADRQLKVSEEVISYLMLRMERSLAAAQALVAALDEAALREKRRITRQFAADVLAAMSDDDGAEEC